MWTDSPDKKISLNHRPLNTLDWTRAPMIYHFNIKPAGFLMITKRQNYNQSGKQVYGEILLIRTNSIFLSVKY